MADAYLLVFSNPVDGRDDDYNTWYDETHLPEVLSVEGIVSAQRFDHAAVGAPAAEGAGYLAIYGVSGDATAALNALNAKVASGEIQMSDALDRRTLRMSIARPRSAAPSTPA